MSNFTPGPWESIGDAVRIAFDENNNHTHWLIANLFTNTGDWRESEQRKADAQLISAAPELLEAVIEAHRTLFKADLLPELRHYLEQAIAKAEGK